jgi:hypothetical protein
MSKATEIKRDDFVKYRKCIYLVKDFQKLDNRKSRLNYYFRSIKIETAKLYSNGFDENYNWQFECIKKASQEEVDFLVSRIRSEHPNFDLSFLKMNKIKLNLNVNDCIEYLKSKGYLVYKQV